MQINYSKAAVKFLQKHNPRTSLNDLPEVEPTEDEAKIIVAYENGDEEYQPYISHEALKKELNLYN